MSPYKLGRPDRLPKVIATIGLVLAAIAVALWVLHTQGVQFR